MQCVGMGSAKGIVPITCLVLKLAQTVMHGDKRPLISRKP